MKKKILSIFLSVLMVISTMPIATFAETSDLFTYSIAYDDYGDGYAVITEVSSSASGMLVIPSTFESDGNLYDITEIDYHALDNCPDVTGLDFSEFKDPGNISVNYDSAVEGEEDSDRLKNITTVILPCMYRFSEDVGLSLEMIEMALQSLDSYYDDETLISMVEQLTGIAPSNREEAINMYLGFSIYNPEFEELDAIYNEALGMDYFSYLAAYGMAMLADFMLAYGLNSVDTYLTDEEDVAFKSVDGIIYTNMLGAGYFSRNPQSMLVLCPPAKTDIDITEQINGISMYAFLGSTAETLVIPASVTTYSPCAFGAITDLCEIEFKGTVSAEDFLSAFSFDMFGAAISSLTVKTHDYGDIADIESCEDVEITFAPYENHTVTVTGGVEATCSTEGKAGATKCDVCGTLVGGKKIPMLPHSYGDDRICDVCSYEDPPIESGVCGDNVTYALYSDGELVISGTGDMYDYTYGDSPFYRNYNITSVVIESGVTNISKYVFYDCIRLESVAIPDTVISIGKYAFSHSGLTSVTIPDSVTSIGAEAFDYCDFISVTIPSSVTSIGENAFGYGYTNSWSYGLYDGFTISGYSNSAAELYAKTNDIAFVSIGETEVTVSETGICGENVTYTLYSNGELIISGEGAMYDYDNNENRSPFGGRRLATSVVIEEGVTSIGEDVFNGCQSLKSVTIADSVTSIGSLAFGYCNGLTSVTIPDNVRNIGAHAFDSCTSLASVTIPASVTSIGSCAFDNMAAGFKIYGYDGTEALRYAVFNYITFVYLGESEKAEGGLCGYDVRYTLYRNGELVISGTGNMYNYDWNESPFYYRDDIKSVTVEDGVTSIGEYAFPLCSGLASVEIADSVTSIGIGAFYACQILTSVTIPASVTTIGQTAFFNCISLTSVTIENGVTLIDTGAFLGCASLFSVTIPESVTSIGDMALGYVLDDDWNEIPLENFVISGYEGTAAQTYANENGVTFVSLGGEVECNHDYTNAVWVMAEDTNSHYMDCDLCGVDGRITEECSDGDAIDCTCDICGREFDHTFGEWQTVTEATCVDVEVQQRTCSVCGKTESQQGVSNPDNHANLTHIDAVSATCSDAGNIEYWYCSGCEKYYSDSAAMNEIFADAITVPAGHKDNDSNGYCDECDDLVCEHNGETYTSNAVEADCHTPGYTGDTYCSICNNKIADGQTTDIDKNNHTGAADVTENESDATCLTDGYTGDVYWSCCNELYAKGEVIEAPGHIDENSNGYCDECDELVCEHNGETYTSNAVEADCHTPGYTGDTYCSICNNKISDGMETDVDLTKHSYEFAGFTWTEGQDGAAPTATANFVCTRDDSHTKTETAVVSEKGSTSGDCQTFSTKTYEASYEGNKEEKTVVGELGEHDYVGIPTQATCSDGGYTTYTCSVCDDSYVADETPELGHIDEDVNGYCDRCDELICEHDGATYTLNKSEADCHTPGYTGDTYCSICNNKLANGHETEIDTDNHVGETDIRGVITADCQTPGFSGDVYCLGCNNKISDGIPTDVNLENHVSVVVDSKVDPTCHSTGLTEGSHCETCGTVIVRQQTVNMTAHKYAFVSGGTDSDSKTYLYYECSNCDSNYYDYTTFTFDRAFELITEAEAVIDDDTIEEYSRNNVNRRLSSLKNFLNTYIVFDDNGVITKDNFPYDNLDVINKYIALCDELKSEIENVEPVKDYSNMNVIEGFLSYIIKIITIISNLGDILSNNDGSGSYGYFFTQMKTLLSTLKELGAFMSAKA